GLRGRSIQSYASISKMKWAYRRLQLIYVQDYLRHGSQRPIFCGPLWHLHSHCRLSSVINPGCAPMEENSMPTYRFPALVWEDHTGHFTAALVEDEDAPAGFGITASDALHQLKEYLDWTSQRYFWRPGPDFMDAKLLHIRVEIRPEYKAANRVYPGDEIFPLRLPVVYGRNSSDTFVCSIPTLNIRFIFHDQQKLKDLVNHYASEKLRGSTPQQLSRFLAPRDARIEEIVVHLNRKVSSPSYSPSLDVLEMIA